MSQELIAERMATLEKGYLIGECVLRFTRDLSHPEMRELGIHLVTEKSRYQWAIGDWLVEFERLRGLPNWRGRAGNYEGPRFQEASEILGYSLVYLNQMYTLAIAFPPGRRIPGVSWASHRCIHRAPAHLYDELFKIMQTEKLSVAKLELRIDSMRQTTEDVQESRKAGYVPTQVQCPDCKIIFPIRGNKVCKESN